MSVTITIEHDGHEFRRNYRISRAADAVGVGQTVYDARHTYLIEQSGGSQNPRATFEHRYGDPLADLFAEGIAALRNAPGADPGLFEPAVPRSIRNSSEERK